MKFFECEIKKIELMKYIKSNLKDYMLTEKDEEYQERYGFYTSASYNIKPNNFKGGQLKSSIHIDREDNSVRVFGGDKVEATKLLNKFNRFPIDRKLIIERYKEVYEIASKLKFYDGSSSDNIIKDFEQWFNDTDMIRSDIEASLKYGVVGKTTTGRSKAIKGQVYLNEHYYIDKNLSIITCHNLEFPMKGLFKLKISIFNDGIQTKSYLTITENGTHHDVSDINVFRQLIEARFLDRYQAAIKKWVGVEEAEFNEDYLLVLEMVKF